MFEWVGCVCVCVCVLVLVLVLVLVCACVSVCVCVCACVVVAFDRLVWLEYAHLPEPSIFQKGHP